jgi:hypothetical protein
MFTIVYIMISSECETYSIFANFIPDHPGEQWKVTWKLHAQEPCYYTRESINFLPPFLKRGMRVDISVYI